MKYELLAPVGNFRNLKAAVDAGCDAVYFGIKGFNMRDTAKNFTLRDLGKMRKVCGDVKMYLTLNTVVYDSELKRVEEIVRKVAGKVDAVICWDLAIIHLCRKYKIPFHVSTQASVSNVESALFYKRLGAERIVLARELSLKQIKKISKVVEVEAFCHGAMCVAVSGRCFMSQDLTGCSANRGKCLQFCRRAWKISDERGNELRLENSRVMSAKDLCSLPFIDKMKKCGVTSFKIEGRNRGAEYVSVVTRNYRKALDNKLSRDEIKEGIEDLRKVYNRGFSSGFYLGVPTADDFSFSEHGEQGETKEFVGRVEKWWARSKACSVRMFASKMRVGDEVYLMSDEMGVRRSVVKSIEFEGEGVEVGKKGQDIGVVFEGEERLGKGVEVYMIKEK
ncbi:U32 family peptidase [Methanococcoides sp. SA1]|nr:U32 family peptidase [Methanococcoides sp. SA1]